MFGGVIDESCIILGLLNGLGKRGFLLFFSGSVVDEIDESPNWSLAKL